VIDVLIAHGDEASKQGLLSAFAGLDYKLTEAGNGRQALDLLLASDAPRVALVDWDLAGIDGQVLCGLVRDLHLATPPYVILLAGAGHHDEVALGLEAGAHDCVRTPVDAAELRARVEAGRRFIELSRERAATAKAMPTPRCDDALTGVLGSEAIVRRLEQELARAVRDRAELSIGLLDVDGLERVNECCGRAAGDAVLREVVGRATLLLRPFDVIGRLGGEEFLIILPKTGELDIASVLDRLRAAMKAEPFSHGGHELAVTVSAGGATGREEAAGELLAEAERTLAEAKAGGRDRVIAGRKIELEALRTRE
jgi:diguanylate cyclase (GGDEF)-like protein